MRKRPYSYRFITARGTARRYLLSGIPPALWAQARRQAATDGRAMRNVILSLLEAWVVTRQAESPREDRHNDAATA